MSVLGAVSRRAEPERAVLLERIAYARREGWPPEQIALLERTLAAYERQLRWQVRKS